MSRFRKLLREIHTRSVWQVLATYVGVSWLVLEIAEHIIGQWGLPEQAYPIALLILLVGLPFVVATAWLQDEPWQRGRAKRGAVSPTEAEKAEPSPAERAARRVFTWQHAAWGGLSVLVVWGALWMGSAVRGGAADTDRPVDFASIWPTAERSYQASLFVSMLRDLSPDGAHGHLVQGITEELIHSLSHLEGLRVPSFTTSAVLQDSVMLPSQIAELLNVDHMLEGTLATEGDSVRVILQLIDAETDSHEWSLEFPGSLNDAFGLRERLAAVVSDSVSAHLPVGRRSADVDRLAESPAHDAYLTAQQALGKRTPAGIREAIAGFHAAIATDSSFAPAYAGLSSAYALSVTYRTDLPMNAYSAAGRALQLATRATEMAPRLAAGHAARGYISSVSFAPADVILPHFQQAMNLEPDAPQVPGWYAHLLVREGRIEEALAAARTSAELSPLAPGRRIGLAYAALHARDYDLAITEARAASSLEPGLRLSTALEARALLLSDRAEACLELELGPYEATRALCLARAGRRDEADRQVAALRQRLEARAYEDPDYSAVVPTEDLAVYYAATGQAALSLEWLERTFSLSPSGVDNRTVESGLFDPVLDEPGYRDELEHLRESAWVRVQRLAAFDEALATTPAP